MSQHVFRKGKLITACSDDKAGDLCYWLGVWTICKRDACKTLQW